MRRVLIDGDGFPDLKKIVALCKSYSVEVSIFIDTSHELTIEKAHVH